MVSIRSLMLAAVAVLGLLSVAPAVRAADGYIGVAIQSDDGKGIQIQDVVADGPAMKAGLMTDDVITKVDGKAPGTVEEFVKTIKGHKPGDEVKLTILRDGKEKEIKIKVGEKPNPM